MLRVRLSYNWQKWTWSERDLIKDIIYQENHWMLELLTMGLTHQSENKEKTEQNTGWVRCYGCDQNTGWIRCYGCDVWTMAAELKRWNNTVEIDYLKRSAGIFRLGSIHWKIRHRINDEETIIDRIEKTNLGVLAPYENARWQMKGGKP